jgi:hypothetical protein
MRAEDYSRRLFELEGWPVELVSFRLDGAYHCAIHNLDPGARIARAFAETRDAAEQSAIQDASRRLARTRRLRG